MTDVFEWTNENKIYVLKTARKDLIARSYWGKTPNYLACLDAIIKDYDALQEVTAELEQAEARIVELEAQLAKAVKALGRIGSGEFSGQVLTSMPPQDAAAHFARITLAELKGQDDE